MSDVKGRQPAMVTTHWIALVVSALYGCVCIAGGIMGYVQKDSMVSLVTGGIAGVLLLLCAVGIYYQPTVSLSAAIFLSVLLLGRFVPKLIQEWDRLGQANAANIALVMTLGEGRVILVIAFALAT